MGMRAVGPDPMFVHSGETAACCAAFDEALTGPTGAVSKLELGGSEA